MKCLSLVSSILFSCSALARSAYGQGTMIFNNLGPNNGKAIVAGTGFSFPLQQDLNFELTVYSLGRFSVVYERSWLLSDGSAKGINVGPGLFADPSHGVIVLPGVVPDQARDVTVIAWAGNYKTWLEASDAGAAWGGAIGTIVTGTTQVPPKSLDSMQQLVISIPEPRIVTVALMGIALFALDRTRARLTKAS
jgi:hypothetical protein